MRLLLLALLLFALPAFGQDQELAPGTDLEASTATDAGSTACDNTCDAVDCADNIDEDPDGTLDGLVATANTTSGTRVVRVDFPTPSSTPSGTTDAQTMDIRMSRCNEANCQAETGGSNPTFGAEVYCGGTLHETLWVAEAVTTLDQDKSIAWTFGGACTSDGSNVELRITISHVGGGGNRRYSCIEAVEWEVTHVAAGGSRRRSHTVIID